MLTIERFATELRAFAGTITGAERTAARACVADALACAAAGVSAPAHTAATAALSDLDQCGDTRPATVWFTGARAGVLAAAYLNSVAVSAHDLDDGHRGAIGHPGGAVIPAVLAELEVTGSTVDMMDAVAFGYEAALRVAEARDPARYERTATGRWASHAAAAASWLIHGDPSSALAHALAHAGSLAPQLSPPDPRAVDGIKEGTPWAVVAGLMAARLARARVPGPLYLLERDSAYGPGDLDRIAVRRPGAVTRAYFKRYACCRWIHPVLDCLLDMYPGAPLPPSELARIDAVEVVTFGRSLRLTNRPDPRTLEEAHYSFPFCVALALTAGADALLPIRPEALRDPATVDLAKRVRLATDPAHDAAFPARTPATVRVHTAGGTRVRGAPTALGDPGLPMPAEALRHKHRLLTVRHGPAVTAALARLLDPGVPVDFHELTQTISRPQEER